MHEKRISRKNIINKNLVNLDQYAREYNIIEILIKVRIFSNLTLYSVKISKAFRIYWRSVYFEFKEKV